MRRILHSTTVFAPAVLLGLAIWTGAARESHADLGDCSQPLTDGPTPVSTDCLYILNVAIGLQTCSPECICAPSGTLPAVAGDALACLIVATGGAFVLDCPCGVTTTLAPPTSTTVSPGTTSTTTTTLVLGTGCPDTLEITSFAGAGGTCDGNEDCPVGTCDLALARCITATAFDIGWTGIGHDEDTNDDQALIARLGCPTSAPCGACAIDGIDPTSRACRCAGDNRIICDEPFSADENDCGGAACECYLGAPVPLSTGNTPACVVDRLASPPSGTIDVDSGELSLTLDLRAKYHLGSTIVRPCPYCSGDSTPADGVRDGTCVDGPNAGLPCDAEARNTSFPAPGGAAYSLDCFPDAGKNISGSGLIERYTLTTGSSSLDSDIECPLSIIPNRCQCGVCQRECAVNDDCAGIFAHLPPTCANGVCSPKSTVPCSSDAECVDAGLTACVNLGAGNPWPNQCAGSGGCSLGDDGDGVCDEGPVGNFCDAVVRANGQGLIKCLSNVDCDAGTIGVAAGNCTLTSNRECFPPTITASGVPHPDRPIAAAIFCVPPASVGYSTVNGLPGPARLVSQMRTRKLCGGLDGAAYVAGGGCPVPVGPGNLPVAD